MLSDGMGVEPKKSLGPSKSVPKLGIRQLKPGMFNQTQVTSLINGELNPSSQREQLSQKPVSIRVNLNKLPAFMLNQHQKNTMNDEFTPLFQSKMRPDSVKISEIEKIMYEVEPEDIQSKNLSNRGSVGPRDQFKFDEHLASERYKENCILKKKLTEIQNTQYGKPPALISINLKPASRGSLTKTIKEHDHVKGILNGESLDF
jgi:hypothetical protein